MIMVDVDSKPISVVVVPLPAQGHLNQLLHLARHLAARNIPVHYVGSVAHNRQARDRAISADDDADKIKLMINFHDIHLPPYPTPPPNPNSGIRFPTHLQPTFDACLRHFTAPVSSLLLSLSSSSRRVTVIHDATMSFVTRIAAPFSNIETYAFHPVSAYTTLFFHLQSRSSSSSSSSSNDHHEDDYDDLTFKDCFSDEFVEFVNTQHGMTVNDHGRLLNTCRVIEGEFIDRAMREPNWKGQKVFALGPLNPIAAVLDDDSRSYSSSTGHQCLDWLRSQPQKSVLYVSFGTTTTLCREQMDELAKGLDESNHRFIWVVREADRGDIYASATAQDDDHDHVDVIIRESTAGKGFVVRGWAPQVEILGHVATAGFLSHCGWNSCMESLSMGVPLLTWPMHSDQPRNAVLVTQVLKAGMVVRDWRRRDEILPAAAVRDSVRRLMEEEEGKEVGRRAMEVGKLIRDCGRKKEELESFVQYINRS